MRATLMYKANDVRVETVPDARLVEPIDALLRVTRTCICGSELWPSNLMKPEARGRPMGHEAIGFVEAVGAEVRTLKKGVLVVMPFAFGATDMVGERGEEGAERVRELTGGLGVGSVLECVGTDQPMVTAMGIARPGGAVGRVGVPHYETTDAWVTGF